MVKPKSSKTKHWKLTIRYPDGQYHIATGIEVPGLKSIKFTNQSGELIAEYPPSFIKEVSNWNVFQRHSRGIAVERSV